MRHGLAWLSMTRRVFPIDHHSVPELFGRPRPEQPAATILSEWKSWQLTLLGGPDEEMDEKTTPSGVWMGDLGLISLLSN